MSLPKHPQYKATDSKLVAEVPKDWQLLPLRRLLPVIESGTSVNALDNQPEKGKPSVLKTSCVYTSRFRPEECKEIVEEELERATCPVKKDSLIVSRMNTPDLVGAAGLADSDIGHLYLPDRLWQVRIRGLLPAFAYYWTQSKLYRDQVKAACSGTSSSMQNLSQEAFVSFFLCRPESGEQNQIANFLDRETAKIDALITEQQRLIELLQEKRQAVISHAVTKGLNPNAPMKDSGVEWLGEVPEHWRIGKLKHICDVRDGTHETPNYVEPSAESRPLVTSKDIGEDGISLEACGHISLYDHLQISRRSKVVKGDLLMPMIGSIGGCQLVNYDDEFSIKNVALFKTGHATYGLWLKALMNSDFVAAQFNLSSSGGVQSFISLGALRNLIAPIVPMSEQREIVDWLDAACAPLMDLIHKAEFAVSLLQERRSALISAAVTGQIDVRDLVQEAGEQ